MSALRDVFTCIDYSLLQEQKQYCENEAENNDEAAHIYSGLVNFIDALQNAVVTDRIATAREVFGNDA